LFIGGRPTVEVETLAGAVEPGFADGPGYAARFDGPSGLVISKDGSLLVADSRNHRIRRISPLGVTTTAAGGNQGFRDGPLSEAQFSFPCALRIQPDDSVLILDAGNRRIRRLTADSVKPVAAFPTVEAVWKGFAGSSAPLKAIVDAPADPSRKQAPTLDRLTVTAQSNGELIAADEKHSALFAIRDGRAGVYAGFYSPMGRPEGWADGLGSKCRFGRIGAIAATGSTIYVADTTNNCIRRISPAEGGKR
jgi:hypothetical protein